MKNVFLAICAAAAVLYIGQWAWSFKTGHDAERAAAQKTIMEIVTGK